MSILSRRAFLRVSTLAAASTVLPRRVLGANDDIRLGCIGIGGRGSMLCKQFMAVPGVRVVALSDADSATLDKVAQQVEKTANGLQVGRHQDFRQLLDRKDVDAVVIASPNHWHALMTIMACEAGKDVYVEKPVCHNIFEGRRMVDAAKRCNRIVQGGFQNRSDTGLLAAFAWLKEGHLGKLKRVRGFCYRNRESIGKQDTPLKPPTTVDYNLWLGPAQDEVLYRPKFHYDWHWFWNTGNGDIGNQGPHELDLCQWALGDPGLPASVQSFGGRFGWQDVGQTANMQFATFEGGGRAPMVFEVCDLWLKPDLNAAPAFRGIRVGIVLEYEGGEFRGGRGGGDAFDPKGEKIQKFPGDSGKDHLDCFIRAVRSRNESELRAPIEKAFKSSALAHMANISYRIGSNADKAQLDAQAAKIGDTGRDAAERFGKQLADWKVDFAKEPWHVGPQLDFDPSGERFKGWPFISDEAKANKYLSRAYREPFVVR
ncbi:MAG TPA: Gfo/Idh/MocA family oxidoreductase [Verrucomicrobiae bacterium]|nr:Gfo/Idh/MocA family oxidoreductase [Verrucomicrobiae bacterium]